MVIGDGWKKTRIQFWWRRHLSAWWQCDVYFTLMLEFLACQRNNETMGHGQSHACRRCSNLILDAAQNWAVTRRVSWNASQRRLSAISIERSQVSGIKATQLNHMKRDNVSNDRQSVLANASNGSRLWWHPKQHGILLLHVTPVKCPGLEKRFQIQHSGIIVC